MSAWAVGVAFVRVMRFRSVWAVSVVTDDGTPVLEWTKALTRDKAILCAGWALSTARAAGRVGRCEVVVKRTTPQAAGVLLPTLAQRAEDGSFKKGRIEASWSGRPIIAQGLFDQSLENPVGHELRYRSTRTGFVAAVSDGPRFWTLMRHAYVGPEGHCLAANEVESNIVEAVSAFRIGKAQGDPAQVGFQLHTGRPVLRLIAGGLSDEDDATRNFVGV